MASFFGSIFNSVSSSSSSSSSSSRPPTAARAAAQAALDARRAQANMREVHNHHPLKSWDADHVAAWLEANDFPKYVPAARRNGLDGRALLRVNREDRWG